jgi:hypothetical protein
MAETVTDAEARVIVRALERGEPHYVCPTKELKGAAQTAVLRSLRRKGMIDGDFPALTFYGRTWAMTMRATRRRIVGDLLTLEAKP